MKILTAILNGLKKVIQSKRYIFLAYGLSFVMALVLALVIASALNFSIGSSMAGEELRTGFDYQWYNGFEVKAQGLASTFNPSVVGIGAVFNGLETMLSGNFLRENIGVAALGFLYALLWTFLSAGFISEYTLSKQKQSFFYNGARLYLRFIILAVLAGIIYYLLFHFVLAWLSIAVEELIHDTIDERIHFLLTVAKYIVVWIFILTVNLIFDYSKILTASKDHKNALTAPLIAIRMIFLNFGKTYGLYLSIAIVWVVLMLFYWIVAPGADQSSWALILIAFIVSQIYLLFRISTRCLFYAGQAEMFKSISKSKRT